jgi:hypothetical protein
MTAEKRVVRKKASPVEWRERIERWKSSGLKAKEFAATENLSARSLTWWHWRLHRTSEVPGPTVKKRRRATKKGQDALSFVPVVLRSSESAPMDLILPGEIHVRIRADFDEATLLRLLRVLGSR